MLTYGQMAHEQLSAFVFTACRPATPDGAGGARSARAAAGAAPAAAVADGGRQAGLRGGAGHLGQQLHLQPLEEGAGRAKQHCIVLIVVAATHLRPLHQRT